MVTRIDYGIFAIVPWLGLMAAGSIGIYIFRDVLGSSFLSRAELTRLLPFEGAEVELPLLTRILIGLGDGMQRYWWALALGACLGGNLTMIGASANIVSIGMAKQSGVKISFIDFMKTSALIALLVGWIAWRVASDASRADWAALDPAPHEPVGDLRLEADELIRTAELSCRIGHAALVLEHQHLLPGEDAPQSQQLVGVDPAVEGGVGSRASGGPDREAVLRQRPARAEALDRVTQQHQQPRLRHRPAQQC